MTTFEQENAVRQLIGAGYYADANGYIRVGVGRLSARLALDYAAYCLDSAGRVVSPAERDWRIKWDAQNRVIPLIHAHDDDK